MSMILTYGAIGVSFFYALYLLSHALSKTRGFEPLVFAGHQSTKYLSLESINPSYVVQDIERTIISEINPNSSTINLIINSLNILGLLGTFLGLSNALPVLLDLDLTNIDKSMAGITNSVGNAFYTSIAGIVCALVLSIVNRFLNMKIQLRVEDTKDSILDTLFSGKNSSRTSSWNPDDFYKSIRDYFNSSMEEFSKEVSESYEKLQTWSKTVIDTNTKLVMDSSKKSAGDLERVIGLLNNERNALDQVKKNWSKSIEQLHASSTNIASMTQNVNNFAALTERLIEQIDLFSIGYQDQINKINEVFKQTNQPSEVMENLYRAIETNINQNKLLVGMQEATQTSLVDSVEAISKMNEQHGRDIKEVIVTLDRQLTKYGEDMRSNSISMYSELKTQLSGLISSIEKQTDVLHERQLQLMNSLNSSLGSQIAPLAKQSERQTEEIRLLHGNMAAAFESLFKEGLYTYEKQ